MKFIDCPRLIGEETGYTLVMKTQRSSNGRFSFGNSGGPGRPRRAIERDYLATLSDAVSPADWQKIVVRALADAKAGDSKARDWLTRHLIGDSPPRMIDLAASDLRRHTTDDDVAALAAKQEEKSNGTA